MFDDLQLDADLQLTHREGSVNWTTQGTGMQTFSFSNPSVFQTFLRTARHNGLRLSHLRKLNAQFKGRSLELIVGGEIWYSQRPGQRTRYKLWPLLRQGWKAFR